MSSAYLRLLIFLPAILIPASVSSSPGFLMMYSAYRVNKQSDNIQAWSATVHGVTKSRTRLSISEVIDISPGNLDSSLCFFQSRVSHDVLYM